MTPPKTEAIEALLYPADVAKVLGVSLSWVAKARLTGDGPAFVKIGHSVRYPQSAVQLYIKSRTRTSTSHR
jgi:predicted DNA-binding transcriptional regulator AlpA